MSHECSAVCDWLGCDDDAELKVGVLVPAPPDETGW